MSTVTVTVFPCWNQRNHKSATTGDTCSHSGSAAKDMREANDENHKAVWLDRSGMLGGRAAAGRMLKLGE
jgi:hypothetical protein